MSINDVYDIYDDAGFDADGLEATNIYDDESIIEAPKQTQAPIQEVKNISKAPEVRKEVKAPPPIQTPVKLADTSLQTKVPVETASKPLNISSRGTTAIHIQNLPWWTSEDDIRSKLSTFVSSSDVVHIIFQEYKVNGKSRGIAYVEFKETTTSAKAKEALDNITFEDRPCSTCFVQPSPTPFQRNNNANARQFSNGQDVNAAHFSVPGNRMRGKGYNQRPGNFASSIVGMNQQFPNSGMPNFNMSGGFPGAAPQVQNFPGAWNQQNASGPASNQSHSSRSSRTHNPASGHHSSSSHK
ncbi:hypothetical protein DSO57_1031115 [Entomophthora muscae]|nr:hypothetical protein DSO57_1031115 [Entomophthora muscae]